MSANTAKPSRAALAAALIATVATAALAAPSDATGAEPAPAPATASASASPAAEKNVSAKPPAQSRSTGTAPVVIARDTGGGVVSSAPQVLVWHKTRGWELAPGARLTGTHLDTFANRRAALRRLTRARRAQERGDLSLALDLYGETVELHSGSPLAAEAFFQRGVIYASRRQFEDAFNNFDAHIRQHPESARFNDAVARQYKIAVALKSGVRPRLGGWLPWFLDTSRNLEYFEIVNRNAPYGAFAEKALYDKGTLALDDDRTPDAVDAFERVIHNYPGSPLAPDAYFSLALTYENSVTGAGWDQSATRNALNYYSDFVLLFPAHKRAPEALTGADRMRETLARNRYESGMFYYEYRNNARAASIFFNEAINAAPQSATAREARIMLRRIRDGHLAERGVMDWIFGRYPVTRDAGFIDASQQEDLSRMGFAPEGAAGTPPAGK
ncbi:MAG: outer membrane protein assembly factor BamD [Puniceicoccales bacterium]|jgi:outer membrane protein assembly factor BamD|nr:outer membrane protein assembly factor BamD [Puniceicoccales bacterium]